MCENHMDLHLANCMHNVNTLYWHARCLPSGARLGSRTARLTQRQTSRAPEWLSQEDTNSSADALATASTSAHASQTAPIPAVKFLEQHVPQNYDTFRPLYTKYQQPPANITTQNASRQLVYYWCGDLQTYSPQLVKVRLYRQRY